jgi:hypothetical protein
MLQDLLEMLENVQGVNESLGSRENLEESLG